LKWPPGDQATIIAAIIVDGSQIAAAEDALREQLYQVPVRLRRPEFISHAKDIWGKDEVRKGWDLPARVVYLRSLIAIPYRLEIPICVAMMRRTNPGDPAGRISLAKFHHMWAFALCMAHADRYIRRFYGPAEVATIFAEDAPKTKKIINDAFAYLKNNTMSFPATTIDSQGKNELTTASYKIERIREAPAFKKKADSPLLQIADALAFSIRRYVYRIPRAEELVRPLTTYPNLASLTRPDIYFGSIVMAPHWDGSPLILPPEKSIIVPETTTPPRT
jgi:hypothetical protein